MAEEKKASFPMLPVAHWWALREKFKQSIPGIVTDNYLATALNTKATSARVNILPYLKTIGLINDDGKTQDLAKEWRDDSRYEEVCKKIRDNIYPNELIAAVHNPLEDRSSVETWFANHTGGGESLVKRMAGFYILLSEADVSKKPEKGASIKKDKKSQKPIVKPPGKVRTPQKEHKDPSLDNPRQFPLPGVNINLEIHISSDSTADQIEKIFESMAKHIYKK